MTCTHVGSVRISHMIRQKLVCYSGVQGGFLSKIQYLFLPTPLGGVQVRGLPKIKYLFLSSRALFSS
jgi:hypothetical protein